MIDDNTDGIGWCRCGHAWFTLAPYDDPDADPDIGPAVCINPEGSVTGYAGRLVCLECGTDWRADPPPAPRPRLRLVTDDE